MQVWPPPIPMRCGICWEPLQHPPYGAAPMVCRHVFHLNCLRDRAARSGAVDPPCPVCEKPMQSWEAFHIHDYPRTLRSHFLSNYQGEDEDGGDGPNSRERPGPPCGICLEGLGDPPYAAAPAACTHVFHYFCMEDWAIEKEIQQPPHCPTCRELMTGWTIHFEDLEALRTAHAVWALADFTDDDEIDIVGGGPDPPPPPPAQPSSSESEAEDVGAQSP